MSREQDERNGEVTFGRPGRHGLPWRVDGALLGIV